MDASMKKIYQEIADMRHMTVEEVYQSMEEAIKQAYTAPQSEEVRKIQAQVPRRGAIPTPEEMIAFLCAYIKDPPLKI